MATQVDPQHPEIVTTIRFSRDELDFLKAYASKQHRTVSAQVRFLVAQLREREAAA